MDLMINAIGLELGNMPNPYSVQRGVPYFPDYLETSSKALFKALIFKNSQNERGRFAKDIWYIDKHHMTEYKFSHSRRNFGLLAISLIKAVGLKKSARMRY